MAPRRDHTRPAPAVDHASECDSFDAFDHVEVCVVARHREVVLADERGDPRIAGWNRLARPPQLPTNVGVEVGRRVRDARDLGHWQIPAKPVLVTAAVARLANAEIVFARHYAGNDEPTGGSQGEFNRGDTFRPG